MDTRHNTFLSYKDSGIEGVERIPSHWKLARADSLFRYKKIQIEPSSISEKSVFHYSIPAIQETGDGIYESPLEIESAKLQVFGRRILVSKLNPRKGVVIVAEEKPVTTICSTEFVPLEIQTCNLRWAYYLLASEPTRQRLSAVVRSATRSHQRAEVSEVFKMWHCVPPLPEQRAIATFLDRETARIDALVAKKERLIELLQEKRAALISHTVTRSLPADAAAQAGLDTDVPMQDSGIEWLGEIPAHWEIVPVYVRYEVALGKMLDLKRIRGDWLGKYIRNIDVQWDYVNTRDLPQMDFGPVERDRYRLEPGDLLVCEGGEVGRTAVWQGAIEECFYQKAIHRVRPRSKRDVPRFFYYVMYSLAKRGVFVAGSNPNTINHLTAIQLSHYRLIFPPSDEQYAIAAFLDRETAKIDALLNKVREAIDRLKELRSSLISAAVTGKIDVREAPARVPDESGTSTEDGSVSCDPSG